LKIAALKGLTNPPPHSLSNHLITDYYEDEWWTTKMVCRYLKLGRKAIWIKRRDPKFDFPKPVRFGNSHYRWRSSEIKQWTLSKNTPIQ
jgi:predicted DNA-binding transcriptional regulator AlpA